MKKNNKKSNSMKIAAGLALILMLVIPSSTAQFSNSSNDLSSITHSDDNPIQVTQLISDTSVFLFSIEFEKDKDPLIISLDKNSMEINIISNSENKQFVLLKNLAETDIDSLLSDSIHFSIENENDFSSSYDYDGDDAPSRSCIIIYGQYGWHTHSLTPEYHLWIRHDDGRLIAHFWWHDLIFIDMVDPWWIRWMFIG